MIEIVPSILSADFARLAEDIARVERGGAKLLHLDVMDGHFVPNLTIGPPVVESVRKATRLHLDVHLMIENPERYAEAFVKAGANSVSVHYEACRHLDGVLGMIRKRGRDGRGGAESRHAGLGAGRCPGSGGLRATDERKSGIWRTEVDSVRARKVRKLDSMRREKRLALPIEIDGGVHRENLAEVVRAGCDWIVTGSAVFHSADPEATVREMREIAANATAIQCVNGRLGIE